MVVWGCRFIFNVTMFFMMIMTGQPTLTHPPRRPHWWKTNDDLLRDVFLVFWGCPFTMDSFQRMDGPRRFLRRNLNRWVEGVVNLPGFPWFQTDPYLSESVVVSIFCFYPYWIGDMTQSDEHMFAKGVETTNLWFTNFQSKFDSSSSQKLEGYFLHQGINDLDKVTNDYIIHIMFV